MAKHRARSENLNKLDHARPARMADLEAKYERLGLAQKDPGRLCEGRPRKPVIVNGTRYENSNEAALAVGVSEGTIREVARGERTSPLFTACWA